MGRDGFFLDPSGDVLACNGMDEKMAMGNLHTQSWDEIWNSAQARAVREAMRHHPLGPVMWVLKNKCTRAQGTRAQGHKCL